MNIDTKDILQQVILLRRWFHENPELSLKEWDTSKRVRAELEKLHIPYIMAGETGIIAAIGSRGKTIALRADMDALPVTEKTCLAYASKTPGVMHACGHDVHTAALLGAAMLLKQQEEQLPVTVKLIFEPSEENCKGAKIILNTGELADVKSIFGLHVFTDMETNTVSIEPGARMAASGIFKIHVKGKGGHAAKPQQCADPIIAAASLITNLQTIISRECDPLDCAVVTAGQFHAGTAHNIIADDAVLTGTVRTFSKETEDKIEEAIYRMVKGCEQTYRVKMIAEYEPSLHPVVYNDEMLTPIVKKKAIQIFGREAVADSPKLMLGEDFSVYQQVIPGVFAFVGAGKKAGENYPNHHEKFEIDESCIEMAIKLHLAFVDAVSKQ